MSAPQELRNAGVGMTTERKREIRRRRHRKEKSKKRRAKEAPKQK
jgi:hypothetical protein